MLTTINQSINQWRYAPSQERGNLLSRFSNNFNSQYNEGGERYLISSPLVENNKLMSNGGGAAI